MSRAQTEASSWQTEGYWPEPSGVHRGGGPYRLLVTEGDQSRVVAPPVLPAKSLLVQLAIGALVVSPWVLVALFMPNAPRWLPGVAAFFGLFVLCAIFGRQWFASREQPVLVIDRAAGTLSLGGIAVAPLSSVRGIDFVRYGLRGDRVTSVGLERLALDLGPGASPRYQHLDIQAANLKSLGEEIAQIIGVPFHEYDRGTIQGHDFVCY